MDEDIQASATEKDYQNAKAYMLSTSNDKGVNVYDHMCKLLTKILAERPENAVDIFEDLSKSLKKNRFKPKFDTVQDKPVIPKAYQVAEMQKSLFRKAEEEEMASAPEGDEEPVQTPLTNLMENAFYFEEASVGLAREEMFRIYLALRQLVDTYPLQKVRFWGKITGIKANYYIAEVEFRENEDPEEETIVEPAPVIPTAKQQTETLYSGTDLDIEGNNEDDEPLPKSDWKSPVVIPHEEKGYGANKFTYFVTTELGRMWTRLPNVNPAQIDTARKIRKLFTGDLEAPVLSYPPFPGTEKSYLRAQIARITASTHISPINYYMFDEEEDDAEEDAQRDHYVENPEFEGVSARDLLEPNNWVHHVQYLLPQGRCTWFNPSQKGDEEFDEEEDDDDREEPDEAEPESGPALLTPLSEDNELDKESPWTLKLSSNRVSQYAVALAKSNLWPGAFTVGFDKKFENLYIGDGMKYSMENYSPPSTSKAMGEYHTGPDVTEADDPTAEEEAALKAQDAEGGAEEEGAEEEEEEEDED